MEHRLTPYYQKLKVIIIDNSSYYHNKRLKGKGQWVINSKVNETYMCICVNVYIFSSSLSAISLITKSHKVYWQKKKISKLML